MSGEFGIQDLKVITRFLEPHHDDPDLMSWRLVYPAGRNNHFLGTLLSRRGERGLQNDVHMLDRLQRFWVKDKF